MKPLVNLGRLLAVVGILAVAGACGDSTTDPDGNTQDFSGNYTLVTYSIGSAAGVTVVPGSTGTFTMTATTYTVSTTIPAVPTPQVVNDRGTYTATGTATSGTFSQQSTDNPDMQYSGTYSWDSATNRLTIDTTAQGVRSVLVLQRS